MRTQAPPSDLYKDKAPKEVLKEPAKEVKDKAPAKRPL